MLTRAFFAVAGLALGAFVLAPAIMPFVTSLGLAGTPALGMLPALPAEAIATSLTAGGTGVLGAMLGARIAPEPAA